MPKLHFKRTPEEEAARQRKKQKKEERRKRHRSDGEEAESSTRKCRRAEEESAFIDDELFGNTFERVWDDFLSQVEEEMFRERMFEELGQEERLDSIEASFNNYVHIPDRWKRGSSNRMGIFGFEEPFDMTDCPYADPLLMDDEEYAEWIRTGMYRLKHASQYAEQQRKKAAYEARKAEKRARKEETARLEKEAEEKRKRKKEMNESRQWAYARDSYDERWKELLSRKSHGRLTFGDIPWPVVNAYPQKPPAAPQATSVCLEDLTEDSISKFLFPVSSRQGSVADAKLKREKLREALRRFHPDKFEGRLLHLVKESDRARVGEGVAVVVRVLNRQMSSIGQ